MTTKRKRVLIVEDEAALARLVEWQLQSAGFESRSVATGKEALAVATEHWPDLVVLDLRLPDMSGYDICRQLRSMASPWELPVLMLTALDQPIDQLRGYAFGADAYMTKPFDPSELVKTACSLLGESSPTQRLEHD